MGCAVAPRGPLQLFCLQRPGPWTAATTPSLGDEVQAGRAGRGTETLRQVPEVRNLLRHLNQRELHAQKVPHAVAVAKERRGARGESREGCGLFQGGQRGRSWHLAGTASAWQPGGVWAGPGEAFLSLGVLQPAPGCGAGGGAGCTDVLSVMREKEDQERRGPSGRSVLQNQQTAKSPWPGTLVLVRGAPFRRGAKGFTNRLRCGFTADNQQLRSRPPPPTLMSALPTLRDPGMKASGVSRH